MSLYIVGYLRHCSSNRKCSKETYL